MYSLFYCFFLQVLSRVVVGATQEEGENNEVADSQPPPGGTVEADADSSNRSFGSCIIIIYVIFTLSL